MQHCVLTGRKLGTAQRRIVFVAAVEKGNMQGWEPQEVARADEGVFFTTMVLRVRLRRWEVPGIEKMFGRPYETLFHVPAFVERLLTRHPEKVDALERAMPFLKPHIRAARECMTSAPEREQFVVGSRGIALAAAVS